MGGRGEQCFISKTASKLDYLDVQKKYLLIGRIKNSRRIKENKSDQQSHSFTSTRV